MKLHFTLFCTLYLFVLSFSCQGQEVLLDGEFRPRFEYRNGFKSPLADSLKAVGIGLQRTRLGANYKSNAIIAQLTMQDSRIYGATDIKQTASLGIYEAYAELLLMQGLSVKIGRQGLQYEDGRLFSLAPWSNTGSAHDLAMLKYNNSSFEANLAFGYGNKNDILSEAVYDVTGMYKDISILWMKKTILNGLNLSLLGVQEGFQEGTTAALIKNLYHRNTMGGTLELKNDSIPLSFLMTAYAQSGKSNASTDLKAYLLAFKVNNKFSSSFGLSLGADYISGTSPETVSTQNNTFNKLYGVNHLFNGFMEYWATLPKAGLIDYLAAVSYPGKSKLSADLTFHHFLLAKQMIVDKLEVRRNIGSELDLVFNYKLTKEAAIQLGYCSYFTTDGTRALKKVTQDSHFPQYAYLMFTIKPQLYKTPEVN
ncbi:alginate export family protein [Arcticibacter eurypsychrophilus]|uniref:alginate export family protein n=1 Tax=Arcticibacter eurypsychrophilus TaxID=1434752 RepID=UPI00084D7D13|nr:alginate export family protein [Arcticibacter eurypsychrophilus]